MKKLPPRQVKLNNHVGKFRRYRQYPQVTLAERVGISRSNLCKIEQRQVVPSVLTALRLAEYLEVPIQELFTLKETKVLTEAEKFDLEIQKLLKNN